MERRVPRYTKSGSCSIDPRNARVINSQFIEFGYDRQVSFICIVINALIVICANKIEPRESSLLSPFLSSADSSVN